MSIGEIIFEHIDEKYAYGKYGEFKIIIMKKNKYINATKLCGINGKAFKHWLENINSKKLIDAVNKRLNNELLLAAGIPAASNNSLIKVSGGYGKNAEINGTYVHSLLIPHIASWISEDFAIKVSEIINSFMIKEYQDSIKQKNDEICDLKKMMIDMKKNMEKQNQDIKEQNQEIKEQNKIANEKLDAVLSDNVKTHKKLDKTVEQLEESDNKLDHITKKLDISVERRVPKAQSSKVTEDFVVMAENKNKKCRQFYFIRGQTTHITKKINTYIDENKNAVEFLRINDIPHAINLGIRIKEYLGKQLNFKYNNIYLKKQVEIDEYDEDTNELSPAEFKNEITRIYEERKQIDII